MIPTPVPPRHLLTDVTHPLSPFQFSYAAATANETGQLTVVWDGDHHVDATNITVYKCGVLGSHRGHADCSLCVTRDPRYKCAWCGDRCEYAPNCAERHETCGKPTITKVGHQRSLKGHGRVSRGHGQVMARSRAGRERSAGGTDTPGGEHGEGWGKCHVRGVYLCHCSHCSHFSRCRTLAVRVQPPGSSQR